MGISAGPKITTDGLVLHIDATNNKSYSGSGITIFNMVTGGIAGTLVNGTLSDIAYKKTFLLDGTNDTIQMQLPSGIVTGSPISISLWAKWKSVGTTTATIQTLVDNQYQVADNIGFFIQDRPDLGSVLEWSTQPNLTVNRRVYSTQVVGDGGWHHIVGTNDGTYSRLYVDGYETGTAKTSAGIATTQDMLCIGNWAYVYSSPRYLNGSVSNFKVYNKALSSTEILTDYFSTKNRFFPNENIVRNGLDLYVDAAKNSSYSGSGATWYDISGNNNHLALVNGPVFTPSNGGIFTFDGSNDNANRAYTWPTDFTFDLLCKPISSGGGYHRIIGTGDVFEFAIGDGADIKYYHAGWTGTGVTITFGSYVQLCGVKSGSNFYIYKNSALVYSGSITLTSVTSLYLSSKHNGAELVNSSIGSFKIYNRALSATEVMQNFNAMRERYNI